ncbi:MAG: hypothetical protein U0401_06800 [Anaerolineae bacterium]
MFQTHFQHATILRYQERPDVAILEMQGNYGIYQAHLREIWRADGSRKYAYYLLHQSAIIVGFDNAPDPRALRLKYGQNYAYHRLALVPHRHTQYKNVFLKSFSLHVQVQKPG